MTAARQPGTDTSGEDVDERRLLHHSRWQTLVKLVIGEQRVTNTRSGCFHRAPGTDERNASSGNLARLPFYEPS